MKTKISNFFKKIFNWFKEQINAYIIGRSVLKLTKALNEIEEKNPEFYNSFQETLNQKNKNKISKFEKNTFENLSPEDKKLYLLFPPIDKNNAN